jgi:hypothetical protein
MHGKATITGLAHFCDRHCDPLTVAVSDAKFSSTSGSDDLGARDCVDRVSWAGNYKAAPWSLAEEGLIGKQRQSYLAANASHCAALGKGHCEATFGNIVGCDDCSGTDSVADNPVGGKHCVNVEGRQFPGWSVAAASCELGGSQVWLKRTDESHSVAVGDEAAVGHNRCVGKFADHADYRRRQDWAVRALVVEADVATDNWNA